MTLLKNEDEEMVVKAYRELVDHGFGDQSISVHRGKLSKNWVTIKKDVPGPLREVTNGR